VCVCVTAGIAQSVLRLATGWTIGVRFPAGAGNFSFRHRVHTGSRPTQPPIRWVQDALSLGVNRPGREADHSPASSAEVKECEELYLHPQYVFMAWCIVKHRDNFTFVYIYIYIYIYIYNAVLFNVL
jgi:hypothetical protein